jgi:hypothetical protein
MTYIVKAIKGVYFNDVTPNGQELRQRLELGSAAAAPVNDEYSPTRIGKQRSLGDGGSPGAGDILTNRRLLDVYDFMLECIRITFST